jgi:Phosphotransferase enzyme family
MIGLNGSSFDAAGCCHGVTGPTTHSQHQAAPGRAVLVHGDFHGDNHLWDRRTLRLRLILDLETAGVPANLSSTCAAYPATAASTCSPRPWPITRI